MNMDVLSRLAAAGVVPVVVLDKAEDAVPTAKAMLAGGIDVMEITFRTAAAADSIRAVAAEVPDMLVGAGTVTATSQIDAVIEAGGDFIVSPGFDPELVAYAQEKGIAVYPGCTTASEYHQALKFGLEVIKFFPAEQSGGLAKIKALAAPFPMFKVMPTGGISLKNLKEYLSCPVIAACGGSYMVTAELIDSNRWDEITALCRKSREIVEEARA
jgi:Entner-Doudoroff aldolase